MKLGINGAGRIGKMVARIAIEQGVEIGCINDPFVNAEYLAYLLSRDSTHGALKDIQVSHEKDAVLLRGKVNMRISVTAEKDPACIEWRKYGVEHVVEATGIFKSVEQCKGHIQSGARVVVVTAPSKDAPMYVMGVNHTEYKGEQVISNASCTTNCLAPLVKVLEESFGVEQGLMTTIHALTATQRIVDGMSMKQYRDGRGALQNIIPASTGAAAAIGKVIPALAGKLTGMAFRVPVPDVSVVDLTVTLRTAATEAEIKSRIKKASEGSLKGILSYTEEDVVSSDFIGSCYSSIFDAKASIFLSEKFVKLVAWYDNEYGYSARVVDLLQFVSKKKQS